MMRPTSISAFVLERGGSANADITIDFDNNLFYENERIDNIAMDNNSNSNTKYVGANCLNNGGDWNQLKVLWEVL